RLLRITVWVFAVTLAGCTLPGAIKPADLRAFTSDGCSLFPGGTPSHRQLWCSCCVAHDRMYWAGGTSSERAAADHQLQRCVADVGEPAIADLMLAGVRVGGSPYWPTSFRWGYGWPYLRGYKPLSEDESQAVAARINDFEVKKQELLRCSD